MQVYYKFSDSAKEVNENMNRNYKYSLEKFKDWERNGRHDDDDYEPSWKYTDQDFIDDAFGGEADAYWNID